jgi:hypothetical protein
MGATTVSDPLAFLEQTVCDDGSVDFTLCTAKHRQTNKELASDEDTDILGLSAANAAAAISGAFVVNGSPTQTAMADRAGARTQFAQLVFELTARNRRRHTTVFAVRWRPPTPVSDRPVLRGVCVEPCGDACGGIAIERAIKLFRHVADVRRCQHVP